MERKELEEYVGKKIYLKYLERKVICNVTSIYSLEKEYAVITLTSRINRRTKYNKKIMYKDIEDLKTLTDVKSSKRFNTTKRFK